MKHMHASDYFLLSVPVMYKKTEDLYNLVNEKIKVENDDLNE